MNFLYKEDLDDEYGKNKYKLHYIYREFTLDFPQSLIFTAFYMSKIPDMEDG